jgi:benzodiazapine receptor
MVTNTRQLAIIQLLFFAFMITMNALANGLPLNGYTTGEISDMYPNLFVPAGFTFSIWGVIYLLLLGYVIYSSAVLWKQNDADVMMPVVKTIAPYFILTCALNGLWIIMWHLLLIELSLVFMLWFLATLILIYIKLQPYRSKLKGVKSLLLYVPFVVYLGWISVATIANTTALLVHYNWNGFGVDAVMWSCIMITIAASLGAFFSIFRRDFFYTLVVAWALYGISVSQKNYNEIVTIAYGGIGLCLLMIVIGLIRRRNYSTGGRSS